MSFVPKLDRPAAERSEVPPQSPKRRGPPRVAARLAVESLEDRTVPSAVASTGLLSPHAGGAPDTFVRQAEPVTASRPSDALRLVETQTSGQLGAQEAVSAPGGNLVSASALTSKGPGYPTPPTAPLPTGGDLNVNVRPSPVLTSSAPAGQATGFFPLSLTPMFSTGIIDPGTAPAAAPAAAVVVARLGALPAAPGNNAPVSDVRVTPVTTVTNSAPRVAREGALLTPSSPLAPNVSVPGRVTEAAGPARATSATRELRTPAQGANSLPAFLSGWFGDAVPAPTGQASRPAHQVRVVPGGEHVADATQVFAAVPDHPVSPTTTDSLPEARALAAGLGAFDGDGTPGGTGSGPKLGHILLGALFGAGYWWAGRFRDAISTEAVKATVRGRRRQEEGQ